MKTLRSWVSKHSQRREIHNSPRSTRPADNGIGDRASNDTRLHIGAPAEILLRIFLRLSVFDLLRCRLVSRHFRDIIDGFADTQYKIELHAAGYRNNDSPAITLGIAERLEMLQEEQSCWKTPMLLCEDITTCEWAHSLGSQYLDNLWLSLSRRENTIRIALFEKTQEGQVACDSWSLFFDDPFDICSADLTTDTLFLLELLDADVTTPLVVLRLRQVSIFDGALIPNGTISTTIDRRALMSRSLCVSPSIVCILNEESSQIDGVPASRIYLTVIHRATSDIIGTIVYFRVDALSFALHVLDDLILLHVMERRGGFTTEVYAIKDNPDTGKPESYLAGSLAYPSVRPELQVSNVQAYHTSHGQMSRSAFHPPFCPDIASSVICIQRVYYSNAVPEPTTVTHIVLHSFFISVADAFDPKIGSAKTISWDDSGPPNVHTILDHNRQIYGIRDLRVLSGYKVMFGSQTLLDFNPALVSRALRSVGQMLPSKQDTYQCKTSGSPAAKCSTLVAARERQDKLSTVRIPGLSGHIARAPTVISAGKDSQFVDDVICALPHRELIIPMNESLGEQTEYVRGSQIWLSANTAQSDSLQGPIAGARAMHLQSARKH